jgi:predicted acyl esterase
VRLGRRLLSLWHATSPYPEKILETSARGTTPARACLWPTAHRFAAGHRIRLQVSSGSHPRYARNLGSGEPLATASTLHTAQQSVHHDPVHPSAVLLPVTGIA